MAAQNQPQSAKRLMVAEIGGKMESNNVLSKVKVDFFAILVPGSFVLTIIVSVFLALTQYLSTKGIIERIDPFFNKLKEFWPLAIVLFIIAYLIGHLIRAMRVNLADNLSKKLFSKWSTRSWYKKEYESKFPYPVVMEKVKNQLIDSNMIADFDIPVEDNLHNVYNFWKMIICSESQDIFSYIQNLESKVRLFSGMLWAGFIGVLGNLIILAGCMVDAKIRNVWLGYALAMLAVSIVIFVTFGRDIRRVRVQEVTFVFLGYMVIQNKKTHEMEKERPRENAEKGVRRENSLIKMMLYHFRDFFNTVERD